MSLIRSVGHWLGLYVIVLLSLGAIFWLETMRISFAAQDVLSSGVLVVMGILINNWIKQHEGNFLAFEIQDKQRDSVK